ncbi:BnaC08g11730D [Brassica napus]|uniref:BnaC08g11730D protein n=4 Tax=Brassica TaxID=3705 RepID=A0A078FAT0_BRANA|nr:hypothetical protein DY000_02054250 [Brassica cretica]CDY08943.1 BnaC08g11730D [Brassica napus]VDD55354.1 unnamed protein product [Brassica oleracea]
MNQSEIQLLVLDLSSTKKPRFRDLSASASSSLLDDSPSVSDLSSTMKRSLFDDEAVGVSLGGSHRRRTVALLDDSAAISLSMADTRKNH